MKKYYAVIDTNVLVSALLKANSVPSNLVALVSSEIIVPILNEEILSEYKDVLNRPKFKFSKAVITDFIEQLEKFAIYVEGTEVDEFFPDPKDIIFYEVTMDSRTYQETRLVTGNIKHFPERNYVVTPREMLNIILRDID